LDQLDARAGTMKGVLLHEFEEGRLVRASVARSGVWRNGEWRIEDGQVFEVAKNGVVRLLFRFEHQRLALSLSPEQLQRRTKRPVDMSARELWATIEENRATGSGLAQLSVLFHLRLALPWACVVMAILGTSLGAFRRGRAGSGVGFGISLVIVFAYYVVMSLCRALGESGNMPPFLAAWTPNVLFLTVALSFSRHVD
jgi:lipopolysaccharide export system permease protein